MMLAVFVGLMVQLELWSVHVMLLIYFYSPEVVSCCLKVSKKLCISDSCSTERTFFFSFLILLHDVGFAQLLPASLKSTKIIYHKGVEGKILFRFVINIFARIVLSNIVYLPCLVRDFKRSKTTVLSPLRNCLDMLTWLTLLEVANAWRECVNLFWN